jgi:hypothetical protein
MGWKGFGGAGSSRDGAGRDFVFLMTRPPPELRLVDVTR